MWFFPHRPNDGEPFLTKVPAEAQVFTDWCDALRKGLTGWIHLNNDHWPPRIHPGRVVLYTLSTAAHPVAWACERWAVLSRAAAVLHVAEVNVEAFQLEEAHLRLGGDEAPLLVGLKEKFAHAIDGPLGKIALGRSNTIRASVVASRLRVIHGREPSSKELMEELNRRS